jgi:hypothetical protein
MRINPNCSCYEGETAPTFWTKVSAMVKVVVDQDGKSLSETISDLDPSWEDEAYYCSWCGTDATVEVLKPSVKLRRLWTLVKTIVRFITLDLVKILQT